MGLLLGNILLDGFEVSGGISFGGAQSLAVHKLPGGTRVIDAMGQDDNVISWRGILSGADASDRARSLDGMRVAGDVVPLAWDVYSATVIVSTLQLDFCNSWWVPYGISCTVLVGTQTPGPPDVLADVLGDVLADLGVAGLAPGVREALALVGAPGASSAGSQAFAAAVTALNSASGDIGVAISTAEAGMSASDLPTLVSSSGDLASLTAAAGYVGRATTNFSDGWA